MKRYTPIIKPIIYGWRAKPKAGMEESESGEYVKYADARSAECECFAELQRILNAQIFYCEKQCPTRDTCTDERRTEEQKVCALFTKEIPEIEEDESK